MAENSEKKYANLTNRKFTLDICLFWVYHVYINLIQQINFETMAFQWFDFLYFNTAEALYLFKGGFYYVRGSDSSRLLWL